MNKPIVSCLWQATLRLKTSVITAWTSDNRTLTLLGYGLEGESHVDC
ncbi:hypothetical protein [Vibrio harveyi]|nr:hypothetical protein [Vibrio harveyi]HDM8057070.1 hypothetical protein [Vibrio harveyi]HDM8062835.1 hypothetical protein [Vibrio harveyi]